MHKIMQVTDPAAILAIILRAKPSLTMQDAPDIPKLEIPGHPGFLAHLPHNLCVRNIADRTISTLIRDILSPYITANSQHSNTTASLQTTLITQSQLANQLNLTEVERKNLINLSYTYDHPAIHSEYAVFARMHALQWHNDGNMYVSSTMLGLINLQKYHLNIHTGNAATSPYSGYVVRQL